MTADALRDRIAAAWSDHETGALHPEGYVPCACGQRFTSPQALARHRADVMLAVLADAEAVGQTCDECSPCWPHRGWLRICSCDCHPAVPAADLEHAMAVIEHLQAENERLREALTTAGLTPSAVDAIAKGEPPRPCPAGHGSQCCGYPAACEAALSGRKEDDSDG